MGGGGDAFLQVLSTIVHNFFADLKMSQRRVCLSLCELISAHPDKSGVGCKPGLLALGWELSRDLGGGAWGPQGLQRSIMPFSPGELLSGDQL